ncbi:hypothetical protein GCM10009037_07110 [Halarchaeum grantii]|uniref:Uncharacterized protein n=1 Tax=Halarchaeum grantii TaxID=1193105 RepID=A0A830F791_9EURY|nr:hypothetical protein [Halarchaeum grantii]GGL26044.1 hypothetical protein GCM10009037_07110 [Halarchaeum grantii]
MSSSDELSGAEYYLDRARGTSLTNLAKRGVGGWLLALAGAGITGMQSMLQLLLTPVELLTDLMAASVNAFFLEPFGIVIAGASASAEGARQFGIFGLIVAVLIVLASFWIVIQYINQQDTTDVPIPGLTVDVIPFVGVDEEVDAED